MVPGEQYKLIYEELNFRLKMNVLVCYLCEMNVRVLKAREGFVVTITVIVSAGDRNGSCHRQNGKKCTSKLSIQSQADCDHLS